MANRASYFDLESTDVLLKLGFRRYLIAACSLGLEEQKYFEVMVSPDCVTIANDLLSYLGLQALFSLSRDRRRRLIRRQSRRGDR